ncbi:hypothetical protein [Marimonas arenosa]|uniref:hypothetical protein n=1 Tax=Marimonas arenosa TaxID=1795305 RepID=UPI0035E3CDAD
MDQIEGIDANKIGVAGFSLGAIVGYLATAVDPRVDAGLFIGMPLLPITEGEAASFTSPFAYAEGFGERKVALVAGTEDQMYSREGVDALVAQMPPGTQTYWIESGHDFPDDTAGISVAFFKDAF